MLWCYVEKLNNFISIILGTPRGSTITSDVIHGTRADIYGPSDDIFDT
jgi:hypothetical protein